MTPEMNNEPNKEVKPASDSRIIAWLRTVPLKVVKRVLHNWPWKLLAGFLALCLWAGLITQDPSLTRERSFTDVPLSYTGMDTLRRNGLIVLSGIEDQDIHVRMRVEVPQREYSTVTYANYNPRVDLSRITQPGEQQVKITTTSTLSYGAVEEIYPSSVTVVVDEYVTNYRVPVSVSTSGAYPEGFYGTPFSLDPSVVAVSGPKSVVDRIARIYVDYDLDVLLPEAGTLIAALPMRFVDRHGNDIVSDLLEVTSSNVVLRSINVKQTLYPMRELSISQADLITGTPAKGYRVTGVTLSPETVRVAGTQEALDQMEAMFTSNTVDVSGVVESFNAVLRLTKPSELEYLSTGTVNVSVTVEPVIISTTLSSVRINARGIGGDKRAGFDTGYVNTVITGPQKQVEAIRPSKVTAYVDVNGLTAGEYMLPVQCHVEDTDIAELTFQTTPATVCVTVYDN